MKRRLSASVDDDLLSAAEAAVREGHAPSVSALVEEALRGQLERTRSLSALDEFFEFADQQRGRAMTTDEAERLAAEFRVTHRWPAGQAAGGSQAAA